MVQPLEPRRPAPSEDVSTDSAVTSGTFRRRSVALDTSAPPSEGVVTRAAGGLGSLALAVGRWLFASSERTFASPAAPAPDEPAPRAAFVHQMQRSALQALPLVMAAASGTGAAIVLQSTMAPTPPSPEFGRMLVVLVLRELAPLLSAILVAGQSGSWVLGDRAGPVGTAEQKARLDRARMVAVCVAVPVLAVHFAAVAMLAAFVVSSLLTLRTWGAVQTGAVQELGWFDAPLFLVKSVGAAAIVAKLSRRYAQQAPPTRLGAAQAASRTFVMAVLWASAFSIGITVVLYAVIGAPPPP